MEILNLTQHDPTVDQVMAGVVNPLSATWRKEVLDFTSRPRVGEVRRRAKRIARAAARTGFHAAMIGGAPFLMAPLVEELEALGIIPKFAFSLRESVEVRLPNGGIEKTTVFKHCGFVGAQ